MVNGSLNWTNQGFVKNYENLTVSEDAGSIQQFNNEFEELWQDKKFNPFLAPPKPLGFNPRIHD
jgi:phosphatidylserine/phosphatidylglycerophosphate/cardiolipin synthase-like enzyme